MNSIQSLIVFIIFGISAYLLYLTFSKKIAFRKAEKRRRETIKVGFVCILDTEIVYVSKTMYREDLTPRRFLARDTYVYPISIHRVPDSIEELMVKYAQNLDWSDLLDMRQCDAVCVCSSAAVKMEAVS